VVDELGALGEALFTLSAGEGPLTSVQHAVADEMRGAREAAATLPAAQGVAVPPAAARGGRGGRPRARPIWQSAASLVRAEAHLQLEALPAGGTGEGPASGGRCRVLLQPWLVTKAFCPARIFTGFVEGSWGLAGIQHSLSIVRGGER
jgi:hypothetical protein